MFRSHPSFARRVDRWLDRCGRAFVMEVEGHDGSRILIGLDPNCDGARMLVVADDDGNDRVDDRIDDSAGHLVVPDDLRDLAADPSQRVRGAARHA